MHNISVLRAISLNNQCAELLENGRNAYKDAIRSLTESLTLVKQEIDLYDQVVQSDELPTCYFTDSPMTALDDDTTSGRGTFIFRRTLLVEFPSPKITAIGVSLKFYIKLSFVILYNLALANHLKALSEPVLNQNRDLHRARAMYEIASRLVLSECLQLSLQETLALSNNLGQIYAIINFEEDSIHCFEHVASTLMFVHSCDVIVKDFEGFFSNVVNLILKGVPPASAA